MELQRVLFHEKYNKNIQLKWHDNFKGIENVPSKPKVQTKEDK